MYGASWVEQLSEVIGEIDAGEKGRGNSVERTTGHAVSLASLTTGAICACTIVSCRRAVGIDRRPQTGPGPVFVSMFVPAKREKKKKKKKAWQAAVDGWNRGKWQLRI